MSEVLLQDIRSASQTHKKNVLHLLRRLDFAVAKKDVEKLSSCSLATIVDLYLNKPLEIPQAPLDRDENDNQTKLIHWWYDQIFSTTNAIQEKMTLFWHNHFTSSFATVNQPVHMALQNMTLRKYALGNFKEFAYQMSIDLAMIIWLNNDSNNKWHPNENYAREFMELFSLGIGNYTEKDVREVARAFTGWRVDGEKNKVNFDKGSFDNGPKTILEKSDNFDLQNAVEWIVSQPACAIFIANKIWKKFAGPAPSNEVIQHLSGVFVKNNYEIKPLLRAMFLSQEFYNASNHRSVVKDPIEYIVEEVKKIPSYAFSKDDIWRASDMGMAIFNPPHVAGWAGGMTWLLSHYIFKRTEFTSKVSSSIKDDTFAISSNEPEQILENLLAVFGMWDISNETKLQLIQYAKGTSDRKTMIQGLAYLIFTSPEAQLK